MSLLTPAAAVAAEGGVATSPNTVVMLPGDTPASAVALAGVRSRAAAARRLWSAAHAGVPEASGNPIITRGSVVSPSVQIGVPSSVPAISFGFKTGTAGLLEAAFLFSSPSGAAQVAAEWVQGGYTTAGQVTFAATEPPSLYSEPGNWTVTEAVIVDQAGNETDYNAAAIQSRFSPAVYNVVNTGTYDDTTPQVLSGRLYNDVVSLSAPLPLLKASITASDTASGLNFGVLFVGPPGFPPGFGIGQISPLPLPISHGAVPADNALVAGDPTGTWNIVGYEVCSFAGNCVEDTSGNDVLKLLGTTTFTVNP